MTNCHLLILWRSSGLTSQELQFEDQSVSTWLGWLEMYVAQQHLLRRDESSIVLDICIFQVVFIVVISMSRNYTFSELESAAALCNLRHSIASWSVGRGEGNCTIAPRYLESRLQQCSYKIISRSENSYYYVYFVTTTEWHGTEVEAFPMHRRV